MIWLFILKIATPQETHLRLAMTTKVRHYEEFFSTAEGIIVELGRLSSDLAPQL